MTFETAAVIAEEPETADLVPSEAAASPVVDASGPSSFPKVLRRRLDRFFADPNLSPKADSSMWFKIAPWNRPSLRAAGLPSMPSGPAPGSLSRFTFWEGLHRPFLLLNIAHDSNHNAISRRPVVNKTLNYVFDLCGISSYMWRILHHRGHHSCINLHGEDGRDRRPWPLPLYTA